jgi:hypothetical protein
MGTTISMSLDGFVTASNQTAQQPMGDGGERLHEWAFGTGTRMFGDVRDSHVRMRAVDVLHTPSATHLRYLIVR